MQVSGLTRHWQTSSRILVPFFSFGLKIFKIRFRFCASLSQPPLRLLCSRETSKLGWFSVTAKTSHSTCSLLKVSKTPNSTTLLKILHIHLHFTSVKAINITKSLIQGSVIGYSHNRSYLDRHGKCENEVLEVCCYTTYKAHFHLSLSVALLRLNCYGKFYWIQFSSLIHPTCNSIRKS